MPPASSEGYKIKIDGELNVSITVGPSADAPASVTIAPAAAKVPLPLATGPISEAPAAQGAGTLEQAELWAAKLARDVFKLIDADESDCISISELIAAMGLSDKPTQKAAAVLLFAALDANSDGKVTLAELRDGMIEAGTGNPSVKLLLEIANAAANAAKPANASAAPPPANAAAAAAANAPEPTPSVAPNSEPVPEFVVEVKVSSDAPTDAEALEVSVSILTPSAAPTSAAAPVELS